MRVKKEDIFFILFSIITAIVFASYRCMNGDFVAYNGDFQNYNIFRRLIAGQIQYKDFVNYLGNGMVFMNFPLICLFRSFGNSVFITNFTTSILYSLILSVSFYAILHERKKAYVFSEVTAIASFIIMHMGFHGTFYYEYIYDVMFMEELGHSMRTTRAFLPFLLVGIFYMIKTKSKREILLPEIFQTQKLQIVVYFVLGVLTIWSNDYGYSCVVSFFMIMTLVNLFGKPIPLIKRMGAYGMAAVGTIAGILLSVAVITHGNIIEYFSTTMGISQYQFWYYGNFYDKYLTFSGIFSDRKYVLLTVFFFLHAVLFLVQIILGKMNDDQMCRFFLHGTCYCASAIYVVGSGAHNYAALELTSYILIFGLIRKILEKGKYFIAKNTPVVKGAVCRRIKERLSYAANIYIKNQFSIYLFAMLFMYCIAIGIIKRDISYADKDEIVELNTYSAIGAGLDRCAADITDGTIFSTYAGALETVLDVFQPTGIDYIIHVLGDEQRKKYIDHFTKGDYKYASTLKNEYTIWEYWSSRVNWYFYRELYQRYKPAGETNYAVIWEESEEDNSLDTKVELTWAYINQSTCRIDVALPNYEKGAYVDLEIRYRTAWTQNRMREGGIRKVVCVQDGGEQYNAYGANCCYYLREDTEGSYIPIYVRNGKGYAYISSYPISCTKLEGMEITVRNVLKEPEFSLHLTNYSDYSRMIATDSVSQNGTLLKFDNTEFAATMLENAGKVMANDETGVVENVWRDGNYIYVSLEKAVHPESFVYPNEIEVEKREKVYMTLDYSDDEWVCGVSRNEGKILLDKSMDVKNLYAVRAGKITKKVISTELTEKGYCLMLNDNLGIQIFAYPQEIELIYRQ